MAIQPVPSDCSSTPATGSAAMRSSRLTAAPSPTEAASTSPRTRSGWRSAIAIATPPAQL
jgi:hypothetical protein